MSKEKPGQRVVITVEEAWTIITTCFLMIVLIWIVFFSSNWQEAPERCLRCGRDHTCESQ